MKKTKETKQTHTLLTSFICRFPRHSAHQLPTNNLHRKRDRWSVSLRRISNELCRAEKCPAVCRRTLMRSLMVMELMRHVMGFLALKWLVNERCTRLCEGKKLKKVFFLEYL